MSQTLFPFTDFNGQAIVDRSPAPPRQIEAQQVRRVTPNQNSIDAYRGLRLTPLQSAVLHVAVTFREGFTLEEIERAMSPMKPQTVRGRVSELKKGGSIIDTGEKRLLGNGNRASVLRVR